MSHKRLVFHENFFFQEVIHPQIFFVIYLYLDASAKRIFKQKNSLADLMHSHISKSDHSEVVGFREGKLFSRRANILQASLASNEIACS